MLILEIDSTDELFDHLDVRREAHPYLVVNRAIGTRDAFVERLRAADTLLVDFDGTIHPGSQWRDIGARLPAAIAAEDRAQAEAFFRVEWPSVQMELALLFDDVDRMRRARFTRDTMREAVRASAGPRDGARELAASFGSERMCVVSFGVYDFIRPWCELHGIAADVAALRLRWKGGLGRSRLIGLDWSTAVVGSTKGFIAEAFCASIGADPARVLAVGDSPLDLSMIHPGNVGVLLLPHVDEVSVRHQFRRDGILRMWPSCSAVLVSDSLAPLNALRR